MKKFLLGLAFIGFTGAGCASVQPASHHHHAGTQEKPEFEGKCAYSVAHGNHDVTGKPEYNLEYKGKTYFFSDESMKKLFVQELEKNVETSQQNWVNHSLLHDHGRK
jgi:YHS domain-containing protein